ncbi:MAG: hypothetical protein IH840_15660 [Candidatus Heimdallarchaeota archaeon]|nr:hypothetical protein [Candidatus Heimdallarchaeota archaeon]
MTSDQVGLKANSHNANEPIPSAAHGGVDLFIAEFVLHYDEITLEVTTSNETTSSESLGTTAPILDNLTKLLIVNFGFWFYVKRKESTKIDHTFFT